MSIKLVQFSRFAAKCCFSCTDAITGVSTLHHHTAFSPLTNPLQPPPSSQSSQLSPAPQPATCAQPSHPPHNLTTFTTSATIRHSCNLHNPQQPSPPSHFPQPFPSLASLTTPTSITTLTTCATPRHSCNPDNPQQPSPLSPLAQPLATLATLTTPNNPHHSHHLRNPSPLLQPSRNSQQPSPSPHTLLTHAQVGDTLDMEVLRAKSTEHIRITLEPNDA